jgi:hypothetical protein
MVLGLSRFLCEGASGARAPAQEGLVSQRVCSSGWLSCQRTIKA